MKKIQFRSLKVDSFTTDYYASPRHGHTYYELIYIFSGSGQHHINKSVVTYKQGDLFLISPDDTHFFVVKDITDFTYIKFTDSYFESGNKVSPNFTVSFSPSHIMRNRQLKETALNFPAPYSNILKQIFISIREYNDENEVSKSRMVLLLVLSIFELIRETALKAEINLEEVSSKEADLISYIHRNIYYPDQLKIEKLANAFNISVNYFSTWFKRNFDISYNSYLNNYKLSLIEQRIAVGLSSLKTIAAEFGFTDMSHFNSFFKRNKKQSPSAFRKLHNMN